MRKSSAPSQSDKKISRATFFSPPYKNPLPNAKRLCNKPLIKSYQDSESIQKCDLGESSKIITKRSPNDLLNLIKNPKPKEKENIVSNSVAHQVPSSNKDAESGTAVKETAFGKKYENKLVAQPHSLFPISQIPQPDPQNLENDTRYFSVVWCKRSNKKHKKWEGDAVLIVRGRSVLIKDMEGREIGRSSGYKLKDLETLEEGNTLPVGAKEIEIQNKIEAKNYISGRCFQNSASVSDAEEVVSPISHPRPKPFRLPLTKGRNGINGEGKHAAKPLYNISNVNSLVLPRPPAHHQWIHNSSSQSIVDVVVDPHLGCNLRPHQKSGVVFLYECLMGFRLKDFQGAILADEMGLGKTLQCISLIWTLLKQGPYGGKPVFKRVLIVTPSSLTSNWGKEFDKWLGKELLIPYVVDQQNKVTEFIKQNRSPILIVSYEMLVRYIDEVQGMNFDLILCDEGHRLKNGQIKTTSLLTSLSIKRRLIVTGTPIQNDLQELYALVEFVNPGMFGSSTMFKKVYEEPILRSQQPSATPKEKEIGLSRATELSRITSQFTLRRTQEIINKYLPPKTEFVVFCRPANTQIKLYEALVSSRGLQKCLIKGEAGDHLSAICLLRKLCNHPALLYANENKENNSEIQSEISDLIPEEITPNNFMEEDSGKLAIVSCLLWSLAEEKRERIVLVSNFTTTLDMLEQLCKRYKYPFLRLDGSTPSSKRQSLVDRFNSSYCQEFIFLLSSKAGGVGLNLIGASRILLYDVDWNPATDLQAMARVWRDGQTKNVYIYRLILAGSIEEKMYERQVCKQGISGSVVDARNSHKAQFSIEDLKDLFRFYPDVSCLTHDLLSCPCDQMGGETKPLSQNLPVDERECQLVKENSRQPSQTTMDQLFNWQHFSFPKGKELIDDAHLECGSDFISYIFKCQITQENRITA